MAVNTKRVVLGALLGSIVWFIWSGIINFTVLTSRYAAGQEAGLFLKEPRYPFFVGQWFVLLFLLSLIGAWIYSGVRGTFGPGPKTAFKVGLYLGFTAGFPISFSIATWSPMDRVFPLWWMLELWIGAIASTFVSGWFYRET